jgi:hypothetical protein
MRTCRLQVDDAEEHSSSVISDSEDDRDALDDALEPQEGSSGVAHQPTSCNGGVARGAHASGAQGCSDANTSNSCASCSAAGFYLDIVESSHMDSQKTSTLSARLRVESNEQVHVLVILICIP